jgi:hypothetical protein
MLIACPCCGGEYHLESDLLDDETLDYETLPNTEAEPARPAERTR